MVSRPQSCQEAEGAEALARPWRAELGPTEAISGEADIAEHVWGRGSGALGGSEPPVPGQGCQG